MARKKANLTKYGNQNSNIYFLASLVAIVAIVAFTAHQKNPLDIELRDGNPTSNPAGFTGFSIIAGTVEANNDEEPKRNWGSQEMYSCTDSDKGRTPGQYGEVRIENTVGVDSCIIKVNEEWAVPVENCRGENCYYYETYCNDQPADYKIPAYYITFEMIACPSGCTLGVCNKPDDNAPATCPVLTCQPLPVGCRIVQGSIFDPNTGCQTCGTIECSGCDSGTCPPPAAESEQAISAAVIPQASLPEPPHSRVWILSFHDEFDGKNIDESKWNINGDYARGDTNFRYLRQNSNINSQGHLVLASPDSFSNGLVDTNGKFTQATGYFSARMKFRTGAFWMMSGDTLNVDGTDLDGAEIDISEKWEPEFVNQALHWDGYGQNRQFMNNYDYFPSLNIGFHEYGLNWQPSGYEFYIDGEKRWTTTGGGVSRQPGFIILNSHNYPQETSPQFVYVDYVHAYQLMPRIPFTYTISPGADSRYPDSNQELNNGKLGPIDLTNSEWTGIIGQPGYYIDIIFNTTSPISIGKITLHSLRHQASGIFLPTKIELYCLGAKKAEWKVRQTSEDGLYQVVLDKVPPACLDSKLRLYNDWWTFLSEITINPDQPDTTAPSIAIIQPDNGATILPPRYSAISGTSYLLSATASDDTGVAGVQFKIDGKDIGLEDTTLPYNAILDTTRFSNGFHTISATARDFAGHKTSILNIVVTIANNNTNASSSHSCLTPDPFVALGGGICYNGGWHPPGMNIFSDVPITHPYYIHVHFMAGKNFMIGYGSNVFGVNDQLTRSQAAVVLSKIFNWDTTPPQAPTFVDVPTTHLYYAQIEAMHRLGITSGCSINPRRYCPDDLITRKQLTTFIIKSANLDYSTAPASPYYDDVNQNDYAYPAIQLATQRQVIEACRLSPRHFCPESSVSRGEAAKLFTLAYNSFI